MGRAPCCDKANVKRGPWSPEEDMILKNYVEGHGTGGNWIALPLKAGLRRCGKSCRLRWLNYLRPDIKHGGFTEEEDTIICTLYRSIGSRWSVIASQLPGRTDNDIKNYWNTKLKKKLLAGKTCLIKSTTSNNNMSTTNINSIHSNPTQFQASIANLDADNYGTPPCFNTSSITLPYPMELNYHQKFDPHNQVVSDSVQFPLPRLMDVSEIGTSSNNYSMSISSQEAGSSLSASPPLALMDNHGSWTGIGGSMEDGFLMDFGFEIPNDILNGFSFQE
ncbi:hypothetical protein L1049_003592 [Liquidambar formosana]|uniref:Uncharacterized protein n=1 Tax=Liquidambar formosana TaxID=63359 RepID=A0AAP0R2Z3_LIQFO